MLKKVILLCILLFTTPCFAQNGFIDGQIRSELPINIPQPVSEKSFSQSNVQIQEKVHMKAQESKIQERSPIQEGQFSTQIQNIRKTNTGEEIQNQQEKDNEASEELRRLLLERRAAKQYALETQEKILQNWQPVKYMMYGHQYKNNVTVEVIINKRGNLEQYKVVHSMQDKKAENRAIKAIQDTAPFAPFPDLIRKEKIIIRVKFGEYSSMGPSYHLK